MLKGSERDFELVHWRMLASGLAEEGTRAVFQTEQDAEDRLSAIIWPEGPHCPDCNSEKHWYIKAVDTPRNRARDVFQCADCGWQYSLRSVSRFRRTRVPLHKLLWAADALIMTFAIEARRPKQTIDKFGDTLGCSYQTARNHRLSMFNELKTVMIIIGLL